MLTMLVILSIVAGCFVICAAVWIYRALVAALRRFTRREPRFRGSALIEMAGILVMWCVSVAVAMVFLAYVDTLLNS